MLMLYKYRSPQQLQFALDILLNKRLYASRVSDLNDPMEGLWHYSGKDILWPKEIRYVDEQVEKYRVASLSANPTSTLMWSHYADSHRGIAIGLSFRRSADLHYLPVRYSTDYTFDSNATDIGADILSRKSVAWEYERECRVLGGEEFIEVEPRELLFGVRATDDFIGLLTKICSKLCPDVSLHRMKLTTLDSYQPDPNSPSDDDA